MKEKSTWFYTEHKEDTKAVILIAHGLNLLPSKMDELATFFNSKKCDVYRISLGDDPNLWVEKFNDSYDVVLEHADVLNLPLYFIGYSLGALIGVNYILSHNHHHFIRMALIAPATHTRFYAKIPAFLSYILPNAILPSLNLKNYRARKYTSLAEYRFMYKIQKSIKKNNDYKYLNIPTLVIQSPQDELINALELTKFSNSLPLWQCHEVTNKDSQQIKKYHHLMITEKNLGHSEWAKMLNKMTSHFSL